MSFAAMWENTDALANAVDVLQSDEGIVLAFVQQKSVDSFEGTEIDQ